MKRYALALTLVLGLAGCKSGSSGSPAGVEPKNPETLGELAVPSGFDYSLTRTVIVEVEIASGADGIAVVQEPNQLGYDPFTALSKGVVSTTGPFSPSVRVGLNSTEIPVLLYRNGAFESSRAAIDLDGTARVVFP